MAVAAKERQMRAVALTSIVHSPHSSAQAALAALYYNQYYLRYLILFTMRLIQDPSAHPFCSLLLSKTAVFYYYFSTPAHLSLAHGQPNEIDLFL